MKRKDAHSSLTKLQKQQQNQKDVDDDPNSKLAELQQQQEPNRKAADDSFIASDALSRSEINGKDKTIKKIFVIKKN